MSEPGVRTLSAYDCIFTIGVLGGLSDPESDAACTIGSLQSREMKMR